MVRILTESGTEYILRNGRLTRTAVPQPYLPPDAQLASLVNVPFVPALTPTVGESWGFTAGGALYTTTRVVSVDRYCARCDTYGDLFRCMPTAA